MNFLHLYLKKNNLTQKELAAELEIDNGTLSRKIKGKQPFTYGEVAYICKRLNIENPLGVFPAEKEKL